MSTSGTEGIEEFQVPLAWPVDLASQAVPVNQVLFAWDQENRDVVYAMFGHLGPPLWLTPEVARQHAAEFGEALAVQPRGSFILSRSRAEEIWTVLGRHLGKIPNEQAPQ
ncbi:hypothetical protein [Mycolicibacter longobardus]|nr:hypothetical protein [Mycolicibacter longobardus]MCV7385379.1 hypothetical protein [Mycolicibacter longobardus]